MALLDRGCGKPTPTLAERADEPRRTVVFTIDPFKDHRALMEARRREGEEQDATSSAVPTLPS
jgi:hypothetical protein